MGNQARVSGGLGQVDTEFLGQRVEFRDLVPAALHDPGHAQLCHAPVDGAGAPPTG